MLCEHGATVAKLLLARENCKAYVSVYLTVKSILSLNSSHKNNSVDDLPDQ